MTCLLVTDKAGHVLLELDEHGQPIIQDDGVEVVNLVPDRIAAAAAGGMDPTKLSPDLDVLYCDDVELVNHGDSWARGGPWVMLRLRGADPLQVFPRDVSPKAYAKYLEQCGDTLRCVIFRADQVHEEGEEDEATEESDLTSLQAFVDTLGTLRFDADTVLAGFGYEDWRQVPPAAIYLWAVDNDVVEKLPPRYRNVLVTEELL